MYKTKEERLFQALVTAKEMSSTPKETVGHFTEMVDYDEAVELIAQAVNLRSHDGRMSWENVTWAEDFTNKGKGREDWIVGLDDIHPAHLDQIATALRRYFK